jgi:hypothetical protein
MEQENTNNNILSLISLILSILSFFITMFLFSGLAVVFGLLEKKKTTMTYIGITIGAISFLRDFIIIASYL